HALDRPSISAGPSSYCVIPPPFSLFLFFTATATPEIYTLSLHDALPISLGSGACSGSSSVEPKASRSGSSRSGARWRLRASARTDRKSTRLNSSHVSISYAVFCLKKKTKKKQQESAGCTIVD